MEKEERDSIVRKFLVQTLVWFAITGVVMFGTAGTLKWPEAWICLAIWLAGALASGLTLARQNPEILKERMRPPLQKEQKAWDKPVLLSIFVGVLALHLAAGLDVRYGWSHMPPWLEALGALALVVAIYDFHIVMRENSYASTTVKIQAERGHKVISTGPYAIVRHPMYAGALLYFLGLALLLGSWIAVAIALALIAVIALRAVWEEDMLAVELPGYADYAQRVKYRLVPHVW